MSRFRWSELLNRRKWPPTLLLFAAIGSLVVSCSDDSTQPDDDDVQITEDANLLTYSKEIGPSGGSIELGDGTILRFPANALRTNTLVSISKPKNAQSLEALGQQYFRLEPSGLRLDVPATFTIAYTDFQDFEETLISAYSYSGQRSSHPGTPYPENWELLPIVSQNLSANRIDVEVSHFSWIVVIDEWVYVVLDIPPDYLKKADLLYALTYANISTLGIDGFTWFPGHAGLYLGTKDGSASTNDGTTIIESRPGWNSSQTKILDNALVGYVIDALNANEG